MPSIYHTSTAALTTPARFPAGSLVVDARYRRQEPPWSPTAVQALFPSRYLFSPSLGSVECSAHDFGAICQVVDYATGLAEVTAAMPGHTDAVILCDCAEMNARCHRRLVARELAAALTLVDAGPLP